MSWLLRQLKSTPEDVVRVAMEPYINDGQEYDWLENAVDELEERLEKMSQRQQAEEVCKIMGKLGKHCLSWEKPY